MKTTLIFGLVAVLLVSSFAADCPLDKQKQPKIYSDSVGLTAQQNKNQNSAQNLVYNYQFDAPFSTTPNVAIGLNQIQASQSPLLDIRVSNPRTSTNGIYFQAESAEQSKWKNFKINFIATTRSDMELGSATIKTPTVNPTDNTFNMIYNIKNNLPTSGLKAKTFLQGINVYSQNKKQIGIKQESASVTNKQVFFTFSSPLRSSIVRSLTISIVVFNIYTPGILYADGIIDQNYVVSTTEITIPRHGINQLRTYIVGINSFETSAAQPISIYSAIDETFSLVIGPIDRNQIDFVSVSYLILSVVDCGSCQGNPLLFDGICQPICPPGFKATKGRCVPQGCKQGQKLSPKGECVPICDIFQQYSSGTCVCLDGYYRINKVCDQCQVGAYYDFKQLNCKPLCGQNSVYRQGRCYCNPGYYLINNRCGVCGYGTKYDTSVQKCVNICAYNQIFSPNGCICANGYYKINGVCARCPYMMIYDPDMQQCVCQQGYDYVYGQCIPSCGANAVRVNGNCQCARGFYMILGRCDICGPQSYYNATYERCLCKPNFIEYSNGRCVPNCTVDQYYKDGKCIRYCPQGQYRSRDGKCYCYDDYERVDEVCLPKCLQYQTRVNGVCKCIPGYYKGYSPVCQKVNCPVGTSFDYVRGDCISVCSRGQVYINGACVCQYGYNNNNAYGECVADCGEYQDNINGFCQCKAGMVRVAVGVCCYPNSAPSVCPPGYISIFNKCRLPAQCGQYQYWAGTMCACVTGYYRVNGTCIPVQGSWTCPKDSDSNGVNCLCKPGYFPVNPGTCERCPRGTYWNGYICDTDNGDGNYHCRDDRSRWDPIRGNCYPPTSCRANQQWDGVSCRCVTGFFMIQGRCQQCPPETVFDGFACTKGDGNKLCRDCFEIWNGYDCVCMPGYWRLANGKCVECPDDTYWDGTCCKPKNGQFIPLTTI